MHALRARFKRDIVAEFMVPKRKSQKVIIFCTGMPGMPYSKKVLEFWAKKGYWGFMPRYRGSWESKGEFLKISPEQDVLDIISELPKGFKSIWDGKIFKVNPKKLYIFGNSFGGPAAILASRDKRVTKAVAISPVTDWLDQGKTEPLDWLYGIVKDAYGEGYRVNKKNWNKLLNGKFYNPIAYTNEIDGNKLLLIHAKDDDIVPHRSVNKFAKKVGCKFVSRKRGGHLGLLDIMKPSFYNRVREFLK